MKKIIALAVVLSLFPFAASAALKKSVRSGKHVKAAAVLQDLAPAGRKNPLPDGGWFTWQFAKKPKLGTAIVKVQVFDKAGNRAKPYDIIGESGMPSMPYHDSGPVKFQLNKKGDYLLPVDLVMPGEWQVVIRVRKDKKEIYAGKVLFTI
ncbi:MAG TPA: hypothetical protein DEQ38_14700 [Elusimicrobia bacterium]|nr:MAG: hypothetical protein A2089_03090 [Elusimicrobia bacterium GWD2_63_28]HCC49342.1 hypothetical protein [Elusimicrobiota bacterium]